MNKYLQTAITIPLTTSFKDWPTRVNITVGQKERQARIEHIRLISKQRFSEKLGQVTELKMADVRRRLNAVFLE